MIVKFLSLSLSRLIGIELRKNLFNKNYITFSCHGHHGVIELTPSRSRTSCHVFLYALLSLSLIEINVENMLKVKWFVLFFALHFGYLWMRFQSQKWINRRKMLKVREKEKEYVQCHQFSLWMHFECCNIG